MPVLYLLAGPNGTGKTTFYSIAVESGLISQHLPFINVDLIAQGLGGYTKANLARASEIYREIIKRYLEDKDDFIIESNLAESRNYEWIASMKKLGYNVVLYYLSTDDVEINIARVSKRVAEGGHDIPEAIIRSRYTQSHSYLKTKLGVFVEVYLIDNSKEVFEVQAKLVNNGIVFKTPEVMPWIDSVLSINKMLENRTKK